MSLAILLMLVAGTTVPPVPPMQPVQPVQRVQPDDADLRSGFEQAVASFRAAIADGTPVSIVALIHPDGLTCADELVPKSQIAACMTTSGARYHAMFFSSEELRAYWAKQMRPFSVRELLVGTADVAVKATYLGRSGVLWIRSEALQTSYAIDFSLVDGRWWITGFSGC